MNQDIMNNWAKHNQQEKWLSWNELKATFLHVSLQGLASVAKGSVLKGKKLDFYLQKIKACKGK